MAIRFPQVLVQILGVLGLSALLLTAAGCRGKHEKTAIINDEPAPATAAAPAALAAALSSSLKMNDPAVAGQLVKGFYTIEGNLWRWTAGEFEVNLKVPAGADKTGATLKFALNVPPPVIQKLGPLTLSASAGATKLGSMTYQKAGAYTFTAEVPTAALSADPLNVKFQLDKFLAPSAQDTRQLGVVAASISLDPK